MFLNLNGRLLDLSSPVVMGIVNVTPDSFYTGSRFFSEKSILKAVEEILQNGGSIVDVGGYSHVLLPKPVSMDEEVDRLSKALEVILKRFPDVIFVCRYISFKSCK
jgi:dihydropteroate synthase